MKEEASSQRWCWISNSSKVESGAPWRCHRPARRLRVLRQTAWSRGRPRPPTGQAGKTPLWIPPRCLEAIWTRHSCPAVPPCHRTPEGGPSVEGGGVESAGLTRGGCTVRAEIWNMPVIQSFSCCDKHWAQNKRKNLKANNLLNYNTRNPKNCITCLWQHLWRLCRHSKQLWLKKNTNKENWENSRTDVTLSAIFSFRKGLIIAKMPLKIRGSFMMLTALILMGNPSCELQLETEQSRLVGHFTSRLRMLIKVLFIASHDKSANCFQWMQ